MRTLLVLLSLVAVAFAGCVGDDPADPADDGTPTAGGTPSKDLLDYEVDPDSANETELMGAHTHDVWGTTDQLKLYEGERHTEECTTTSRAALLAIGAIQDEQEVHYGCVDWRFDDGVVLPEGTERLEITVDATDALDQGAMQLWYRNHQKAMQAFGEPQTDGVATWVIDVAQIEWDIPHAEETTWFFMLRPSGNPAMLEGAVTIETVAHKIPDWTPILGSAHIDHWASADLHNFVTPDIMQILSTTVDLKHASWVSQTSGTEPGEAVPLDDIIAPMSTTVAVVLKYDGIDGCPAGHEPCWVRPSMQPTGTSVKYQPTLIELSATYGVYKWDIPEPVVPDSTYATASGYSLFMDIRGCPNGEDPEMGRIEGCAGDLATDLGAQVTILMEAYRGTFDANGIKQRAEV